MDKKDNKTTCMACSCPCEAHKEHNHPVEKKCGQCGHTHKEKGGCDCGCK